MNSLAAIGEVETIRRLTRQLPKGGADVRVGVGDDCAVVRPGRSAAWDWLLKSDPVIEGVHFTAETPGRWVGHKAIGRVLSDLAAMGGEPLWALIDVVAPPATPLRRLTEIYRGAARLAQSTGLTIVGGDTSVGQTLELHVFAVGRVPCGKAVLRTGARPGDWIYVTGSLGGSGSGKHLRFTPRLAEGAWLRQRGWARSMVDLSDGLATDLRHMLTACGTGAELDAQAVPVAPAAAAARGRRTGLDHALCDGEDFELLFTVAPGRHATFARAWTRRFVLPCTCIGRMTQRPGVIEILDPDGCRTVLREHGYEHFRQPATGKQRA